MMKKPSRRRQGRRKCQVEAVCCAIVAAGVAGLLAAQVVSPYTFICPMDSYCIDNKYIIKCSAGRYGNSYSQTSANCSGVCPQGYYCPAGTTWQSKRICPLGNYCPQGSPAPIPCDAGRYGGRIGLYMANCSGFCDAGYTCSEGSAVSNLTVCPKGHYCPIGSALPAVCPIGYYGDVEGLSDAGCSGLCPGTRGSYCPAGSTNMTLVPCPLGSYCDGSIGSGSIAICPNGTYGATLSLETSQCSGPCYAGYYCRAGSVSPTEEDCGAGYYCSEGTAERKPCPAGRYGSLLNMFSSTCEGVCNEGYFCNGSATTPTYARCPAGYYCEIGETNPKNCPPGSLCREASSSGGVNCPRGYYCPGNTGTPISCPAGTYGGVERLQDPSCSGPCPAGWYCVNATVFPQTCPAGSYCLAGTGAADQYLCPGGAYSIQTGLATIEQCAGAGSGGCASGYYCPPGSTSHYAVKCPWNHFCPPNSSAPQLCNRPGFYCAERADNEEMLRDYAQVIILNTIPAKAVLWAQDFPAENERARVLGISTVDAFIKAAFENTLYRGPTYAAETFQTYSRGLDKIFFNVTTKGFYNASIGLCNNGSFGLITTLLNSFPLDASPTAHLGFKHVEFSLPRDARLGLSTICVLSANTVNWTSFSDEFDVIFAGQVTVVKATAQTLSTLVISAMLCNIWVQHKTRLAWTRVGEIDLMIASNPSRRQQLLALTRVITEVFQYCFLILMLDTTSLWTIAPRLLALDLNLLPGYLPAATLSDIVIVVALLSRRRYNRKSQYQVRPEGAPAKRGEARVLKLLEGITYDFCFFPVLLAELRVLDCTYTHEVSMDEMEFFDQMVVRGSYDFHCWSFWHGVAVAKSILLSYLLLQGAINHLSPGTRNPCVAMIPGVEAVLLIHKVVLVFFKVTYEHYVEEIMWSGFLLGVVEVALSSKLLRAQPFLGNARKKNFFVIAFHLTLANAYVARGALFLGIPGVVMVLTGVVLELLLLAMLIKRWPRQVVARQFDELVTHGSKEVRAQCLKEAHSFAALTTKNEDFVQILRTLGEHLEDFEHEGLRAVATKAMARLLEANALEEETAGSVDACRKVLGSVQVMKLGDSSSYRLKPRVGLQSMLSSTLFLDLSNQSLSDGAAKLIAVAVADSNTLKALNISQNEVTSSGIQVLCSALGANVSVSTLLAGENPFTMEEILRLSEQIADVFLCRRKTGAVAPLVHFGDALSVRFMLSESHDQASKDILATNTTLTLPEFTALYAEPSFNTARHAIIEIKGKIRCSERDLKMLLQLSRQEIPVRFAALSKQDDSVLRLLGSNVESGVVFSSVQVGSFAWTSRIKTFEDTRKLSNGEVRLLSCLIRRTSGLKVVKLPRTRMGTDLSRDFGDALLRNTTIEELVLGSVTVPVLDLKQGAKRFSILDEVLPNEVAIIVCALVQKPQAIERIYAYSTALTKTPDNALTDDAIDSFAQLPLQKLVCGGAHGGNLFTMKIAKRLSKARAGEALCSLDLRNNPLGTEEASSLEALLLLEKSKLLSLKLDGCSIGNQGAEAISHALRKGCTLTKLSLGHNKISHESASALFEALAQHKHHLKKLTLDDNDLYVALPSLANFVKVDKRIESLSMASCKLEAFAALSEALGVNSTLIHLNLAHNSMSGRGFFRFLGRNKTVENLGLSHCDLQDDDLQEMLTVLEKNHALQVVDLSENDITDDGGQYLLQHLSSQASALHTVCFSSNRLIGIQLKENLGAVKQLVIL